MKDLLIQIVQALVDNPEKVQVTEIESARTVLLELSVAESDKGMIIGKKGRTANAIRALLNAASAALTASSVKSPGAPAPPDLTGRSSILNAVLPTGSLNFFMSASAADLISSRMILSCQIFL